MDKAVFRRVGLLAATAMAAAVLAALPGAARAGGPPSPLNDACQPDPTLAGPQELHCRYGPITVRPGDNLILFGPVTIESPRADGFVTRFEPDLVDSVTGEVPPIHEVHLHHGVWLNPASERNPYEPFFASGEEKTVSELPPGHGYRTRPWDTWVLNYMIHNLTAETWTVTITYDLTWWPAHSGIQAVEPVWLDVVGGAYPVYDPELSDTRVDLGQAVPAADPFASGRVREWVDLDHENPRPSGPEPDGPGRSHFRRKQFRMPADYELVWAAGHTHPGGLRDELRVESCDGLDTDSQLVFKSDAVFNQRAQQPPGSQWGSWDFLMTATPADWKGVRLKAGDVVSLTSVYDTENPWYEAMGIMFAWARPLPAGTPAHTFCDFAGVATAGDVTDTAPVRAPYFGGTAMTYADPTQKPAGEPVEEVRIAAFTYLPGAMGTPPPAVEPGDTVRFVNDDAAASIFHSVTSCQAPCNLDYGQSYPLATWKRWDTDGDGQPDRGVDRDGDGRLDFGFDSLQLGYGPPQVTAAANTHRFDLRVPADAQPGETLTYYCRVHPFMRGALRVVDEA